MNMIKTAMAMAAGAALAACTAHTPALTAGGGSGRTDGPAYGAAADTAAEPAGRLRLRPTMAITQRGRSVSLSAEFFLELRADSVVSHLPYFGRAYMPPMGTDNVLDFAAPARNLTSGRTAEGARQVEFSARTIEDVFRFRIRVYDDGQATIDVRPQRRDQISFDCDVEQQP